MVSRPRATRIGTDVSYDDDVGWQGLADRYGEKL